MIARRLTTVAMIGIAAGASNMMATLPEIASKSKSKCRSKIPHFGGPAVGRFKDRQLRFSVSADVPCASGAAEA